MKGRAVISTVIKKLELASGTPTKSMERVARSICAVPVDALLYMPHMSGETNSMVEVTGSGHLYFWDVMGV